MQLFVVKYTKIQGAVEEHKETYGVGNNRDEAIAFVKEHKCDCEEDVEYQNFSAYPDTDSVNIYQVTCNSHVKGFVTARDQVEAMKYADAYNLLGAGDAHITEIGLLMENNDYHGKNARKWNIDTDGYVVYVVNEDEQIRRLYGIYIFESFGQAYAFIHFNLNSTICPLENEYVVIDYVSAGETVYTWFFDNLGARVARSLTSGEKIIRIEV